MTEEKVIRRAIETAKMMKTGAKAPAPYSTMIELCQEGTRAINALVGLLRQKETAPGDSSTGSGKAGPAPRGRNTTPLL